MPLIHARTPRPDLLGERVTMENRDPSGSVKISHTGGLGLMPKHVWKGVISRDPSALSASPSRQLGGSGSRGSFFSPSPETSYSRNISHNFDSRPNTSLPGDGRRTAPSGTSSPRRGGAQGQNWGNASFEFSSTINEAEEHAGGKDAMGANRYSFNSSSLRHYRRREMREARRTSTAPSMHNMQRERDQHRQRLAAASSMGGMGMGQDIFLDTEVAKLQGQIQALAREVELQKDANKQLLLENEVFRGDKEKISALNVVNQFRRAGRQRQKMGVPKFNRRRHRGVQTGGGEMASEARIAQLLHKNPQLKELAEAIATATGGELYNLVKMVTIHVRELAKADRCTAFLASREFNELWALQVSPIYPLPSISHALYTHTLPYH